MEKKYNLKSPAVKRLMREARELCEATEQYYAQPLEDNLFEWHFTVQGADDSDFESGRYHGRITLPPEYPMKPPSIILLTPNGRFETGKKICLSMSAHHPETWQPSWSIRTVLLAIIGFMPTKGGGAIGALDYTSEERKALAKKSLSWKCDVCGSCTIDALKEPEPGHQRTTNKEAEELALQINFKGENEKKSEKSTDAPDGVTSIFNSSLPDNSMNIPNGQTPESSVLAPSLAEVDGIDDVTSGAGGAEQSTDSGMRQRVQRRSSAKRISQSGRNVERTASERSSSSDYSSAILILILSVCFLLLLFRRIYKEYYLKTN